MTYDWRFFFWNFPSSFFFHPQCVPWTNFNFVKKPRDFVCFLCFIFLHQFWMKARNENLNSVYWTHETKSTKMALALCQPVCTVGLIQFTCSFYFCFSIFLLRFFLIVQSLTILIELKTNSVHMNSSLVSLFSKKNYIVKQPKIEKNVKGW